MSNPMKNEQDIYERIKSGKLTVSSDVLSMLAHHIGNDVQVIMLSMHSLRQMPRWILGAGSFVIKTLYKVTRQPGQPPKDISFVCDYTLDKAKSISDVLAKLKKAVRISEGVFFGIKE